MPFRTRLLPVVFLSLCAWVTACSITSKAARHAADVAEANRLYRRADDFVNRVTEGKFSYSYMQFYWKRAESYIERVERDYPDTPIGKKLIGREVKVGPFGLQYFKDRVLPWLEVKRLGSFDAVYCAIFLYDMNPDRWDQARLTAFSRIIEVLSRQDRWSEARIFPIPARYQSLKVSTMFRVAAQMNRTDIVAQILATVTPAERETLYPIQGEEMAIRGGPRKEIAAFLDKHSGVNVRLAILKGMIRRETKLQRAAALRQPLQDVHLDGLRLQNPGVRDNIDSVAHQFFPDGNSEASGELAVYRASLGDIAAARHIAEAAGLTDLTAVHLAYLDYLAAFEKYDQMNSYVADTHLSPEQVRQCRLKIAALLARAGRIKESEQALHDYLQTYAHDDPSRTSAAVLEWFLGRIETTGPNQLVVRAKTFSDLPIKDPCVMAQAIMDWSLAPNRTLRGASPWDSVVYRFRPGFTNLPAPNARDMKRAAAVLPEY